MAIIVFCNDSAIALSPYVILDARLTRSVVYVNEY
jgi:hypothetical protein